jgi:hypothetical protein
VVRPRLLHGRRILPLHAIHDEDWDIGAVRIPPAVYLAVVDCDVLVQRVVPSESGYGSPYARLAHLKEMPNVCRARFARAAPRDVDFLDGLQRRVWQNGSNEVLHLVCKHDDTALHALPVTRHNAKLAMSSRLVRLALTL